MVFRLACSFMHACFVCLCIYCRGIFKAFNIPQHFLFPSTGALYLLVPLRFCNDAVISRPLFEFSSNPRSDGFWLVISFRFRLKFVNVFLMSNVRSGEVGTLIKTLHMSTTCSRVQARAGDNFPGRVWLLSEAYRPVISVLPLTSVAMQFELLFWGRQILYIFTIQAGCLKKKNATGIKQAVVHYKRGYKQFNFYIGRKNIYLAFQWYSFS